MNRILPFFQSHSKPVTKANAESASAAIPAHTPTRKRRHERPAVAVIESADPNWRPSNWSDSPATGRILDCSRCKSLAYAEGLVHSYNSKRLGSLSPGEACTRWAVLIVVEPGMDLSRGVLLERRIAVFAAGE